MTKQEAIRHLQAARLMLLGKDGQPISDLYDALSIAIDTIELSEIEELCNLPVDYSRCVNIYYKNHSENPNS